MADIIWPQKKKWKSKTRQNKERRSWSPEILHNYEMQSDPIQSHLSRDGLDLWTPAELCPKREFQIETKSGGNFLPYLYRIFFIIIIILRPPIQTVTHARYLDR